MNRVGFRSELRRVAIGIPRVFLVVFGAASLWCGVELMGKENTRLIQNGLTMLLIGFLLAGLGLRRGADWSRPVIWGTIVWVFVAALVLVFGVSESLVWKSQNP